MVERECRSGSSPAGSKHAAQRDAAVRKVQTEITWTDTVSHSHHAPGRSAGRPSSGVTGPTSEGPSSRPWVGGSILLIGVLHVASSPALYGPALDSIVAGGIVNTLDTDPQASDLRAAGFWFVSAGLIVILLGLVVAWVERCCDVVPGFLGPGLIIITAFGVVIAPTSGFWLFLVPATLALWKHRHRRRSG